MSTSRHAGTPAPMQSFDGLHLAIIMDGNGRWATAHGLSRSAGHEAGLRTARNIVEASVREGVGTLTLYAFSSDNWKRPGAEVTALMRLFRRALLGEAKRCLENGVRLTILGRRDRLPSSLRHTVEQVEALTSTGARMHLRVAVDYSGRDAMLRAAAAMRGDAVTREGFSELLARVDHDRLPARDVDLVVRTGGRAAAERLPALGVRLCRAAVREADVAGVHRRRPGGGARGLPQPKPAVRAGP